MTDGKRNLESFKEWAKSHARWERQRVDLIRMYTLGQRLERLIEDRDWLPYPETEKDRKQETTERLADAKARSLAIAAEWPGILSELNALQYSHDADRLGPLIANLENAAFKYFELREKYPYIVGDHDLPTYRQNVTEAVRPIRDRLGYHLQEEP